MNIHEIRLWLGGIALAVGFVLFRAVIKFGAWHLIRQAVLVVLAVIALFVGGYIVGTVLQGAWIAAKRFNDKLQRWK